MLSQGSSSLAVSHDRHVPPLTATPFDIADLAPDFTVAVTALPARGEVFLSDGVTPVVNGQALTLAQLSALRFRVADSAGLAAAPAGQADSAAPLVTVLHVPQGDRPRPIGIQPPDASLYSSSQSYIRVTELPANGAVLLADGTAVKCGQALTVPLLAGLMFRPDADACGHIACLGYRVFCPGRESVTGWALLVVGPPVPALSTPRVGAAVSSGVMSSMAIALLDAALSPPSLAASGPSNQDEHGSVARPPEACVLHGDGQNLTMVQFASPTVGQASGAPTPVVQPDGSIAPDANVTIDPHARIGSSSLPLATTPASTSTLHSGGNAATPVVSAAQSVSVQPNATSPDINVVQSASVLPVATTLFTALSAPSSSPAGGATTLAVTPNAIVLENQKAGTPQSVWQIDPGQDSTLIQGFTTEISTNLGGQVDFKINNHTGNPNYQINIYRLGYYNGDGARLITTIQHQAATSVIQPNPLTDPSTGLVDAGNWSVTDSWSVPSDLVSGVYIANVVDGTQVFQIPFVIRDDSSHSDIVFQTDDQTWQAYNGWGGADVYGGNGPGYGGAAYAVSYNRPITTRDGSGGGEAGTSNDMVFGAEYPAIQWLEQNGYDVSYISGIDAATNGALLLNHRVYMEAGHDEYWTNSQVANVQAAAHAGVNLVFLSGNEIYWQTRLAPSIDGSDTANRTLITYKDTHANAVIDPTGTATGSYLDARFASSGGMSGVPSNALTGTLFQVDSERADIINIPYDMTQLRFWRGTAVANTAPGQTASLVPNLLGYEWDSSPDNGFRPAGLISLSSTTLQVSTDLLDYGNTTGNGTATHNLVEYRDPVSGALIFGAGTVFWSWGLSTDHDQVLGPPNPVDPNVQQATVNLLADMGVQPETLQASLIIATQSTDHTAPTAAITGMSTSTVLEGQTVTVTGTASDVGGVIGGVEVSTDSGSTWHPATAVVGKANTTWSYTFKAGASGVVNIEARAVDDSLNLGAPGAGVPLTITPSSNLTIFSPTDVPTVLVNNDPESVELGVKFVSASSGEITGIRFYKSAQNTGTHTGSLWTSTGTLLASATFTSETASGWQQVNFATPVRITAGVTYVASYHTDVGAYSSTDFYFDNQGTTNGSLTATGSGLNGVYAYGTGPLFPNEVSIAKGDNYWVDVVFDNTSQQPQANDDGGFVVTEDGALSISAATLLANDTDPAGLALSVTGVSGGVHGSASYDPGTQTVTFMPTAGYTGPATFTYTISDTQGGTGSGQVSVKVNYPVSAQSLFGTTDAPTVVTVNDPSAVELGVKFTTSANGLITGLRFYKGPQNTGTHIADIWSSTGTLLATATFTNETASGWQQVSFSNPVFVTAGTTYIASYHSDGNYSADLNYFANPLTNGQLTAPADSGVYAYGNGSTFPTSSYKSSNYWVDVVFDGAPLQPPIANNDSGLSAAQNGTLTIAAATLLANDTDPNGLALSISSVGNASNGAVSYDANTQTVSFVPTAGYLGPASFSYTITDGQAGTSTASVSLNVVPPPPVAVADGGFIANENGTLSISAATLLANDTDPNGLALSLTGVSNPAHGTVSFDVNTGTVTFTPANGYTGTATFTYSIADTHGGTASGNVALIVNDPLSQSLFSLTSTPGTVTSIDPGSVELGVKFTAAADGTISGIRFYKGPENTATHVADLWSSTGTLLATATFTNETASGWQQVNFSTPVTITAGTTYIASYHTSGSYSADANYFATSLTEGQLSTPANAGVYAYGPGSVFPTSTINGTNYWVDVVYNGPSLQTPVANNDSGFSVAENGTLSLPASAVLANDTGPSGLPLSVVSVGNPGHGTVSYNAATQTITFVPTTGYAGPATFTYTISDGQSGGTASADVALTVSPLAPVAKNDDGFVVTENNPLSISASALLANDTDPSGLPLSLVNVSNSTNGTAVYDSNTGTITFTPTAGYTGTASFAYSVTDANGGVASASASLLVNDPTIASLFDPASTPGIVTVNDPNPVELGFKFVASSDGQITGLRFYKSEDNTGEHVADIWSSTGTLLASQTFTNETASGWQQVNFTTPVTVTAGTTYVASYHTNGDYSADPDYFATSHTNGPLTAPSSSSSGGNGVYAYGSSSLFPTNNYNSTSYGVDVLFRAQLVA